MEPVRVKTDRPWEPGPRTLWHVPGMPNTPLDRSASTNEFLSVDEGGDPIRLKPPEDAPPGTSIIDDDNGRCIHVVLHKNAAGAYETWIDGRQTNPTAVQNYAQDAESRIDPQVRALYELGILIPDGLKTKPSEVNDLPPHQLPPPRMYNNNTVASPVAFSCMVAEGVDPPQAVTVKVRQRFKAYGKIIEDDVPSTLPYGSTFGTDDCVSSFDVTPVMAGDFTGQALVLPYPSAFVQSPHIYIRDVLPLRQMRARAQVKLISGMLMSIILFVIQQVFLFGLSSLTGTMTERLRAGFGATIGDIGLELWNAITSFGPQDRSVVATLAQYASIVVGFGLPTLLQEMLASFTSDAEAVFNDGNRAISPEAATTATLELLQRANVIDETQFQRIQEERARISEEQRREDELGISGVPASEIGFNAVAAAMNDDTARNALLSRAVPKLVESINRWMSQPPPPKVHRVRYSIRGLADSLALLGKASAGISKNVPKSERVLADYLSELSEYEAFNPIGFFARAAAKLKDIAGKIAEKVGAIPPYPRVGPALTTGLALDTLIKRGLVEFFIDVEIHDTNHCSEDGTSVEVVHQLFAPSPDEATRLGVLEAGFAEDVNMLKQNLSQFISLNSSSPGSDLFDSFNLKSFQLTRILGVPFSIARYMVAVDVLNPQQARDSRSFIEQTSDRFRLGAQRLQREVVDGALDRFEKSLLVARVAPFNPGQEQYCRVFPSIMQPKLQTPSVRQPKTDKLRFVSSESTQQDSDVVQGSMDASEVGKGVHDAIRSVRRARVTFRTRSWCIDEWQRTSRRLCIVQFREPPLLPDRLSLRVLATHTPFAFCLPLDVSVRAGLHQTWEDKNVESLVARSDDSMWTALGIADTPSSWSATKAFADLWIDVAQTEFPLSVRLMKSGVQLVQERASTASGLLLQVSRLAFRLFKDEVCFQTLPGGVDLRRVLDNLQLLQDRRALPNGMRVTSTLCREITDTKNYMAQSESLRAAIEYPPTSKRMLSETQKAFQSLATSDRACNGGVGIAGALAVTLTNTTYPASVQVREQLVMDSLRRRRDVQLVANAFLEQFAGQAVPLAVEADIATLLQQSIDSQPSTMEHVGAQLQPRPPQDIELPTPWNQDEMLKSLVERNARMIVTMPLTFNPAYMQPDDSALEWVTKQVMKVGISKADGSSTYLVPFAAGDYWSKLYRFPKSGGFYFDLVPIRLSELRLAMTELQEMRTNPATELSFSVMPSVAQRVYTHIQVTRSSTDAGQLTTIETEAAMSEDPQANGVGSLMWNAERIVQSVLVSMGHQIEAPAFVNVALPIGYTASLESIAAYRRQIQNTTVARNAWTVTRRDSWRVIILQASDLVTAIRNGAFAEEARQAAEEDAEREAEILGDVTFSAIAGFDASVNDRGQDVSKVTLLQGNVDAEDGDVLFDPSLEVLIGVGADQPLDELLPGQVPSSTPDDPSAAFFYAGTLDALKQQMQQAATEDRTTPGAWTYQDDAHRDWANAFYEGTSGVTNAQFKINEFIERIQLIVLAPWKQRWDELTTRLESDEAELSTFETEATARANEFNTLARRRFVTSLALAQTLLRMLLQTNAPRLCIDPNSQPALMQSTEFDAFRGVQRALAALEIAEKGSAGQSGGGVVEPVKWLLLGEIAAFCDVVCKH